MTKMFPKTALAALFAASLPAMTMAQGFTGAELSAGMLALTEDTNFGASSYKGSAQFGIVPGVAVAADISRHNWRGEDGNSTAFTIHGLYELGYDLSAGVYIGQDRRDSGNTDVYGIEAAGNFSGVVVEGFFGRYDGNFGEGTMLGVNGSFALTQDISATGRAGLVNGRDDMTSVAIGGEYRFFGGPQLFAEIGRSDFDGDGDTFVTIGGKVAVGRGTAFSGRGITDIFPNF